MPFPLFSVYFFVPRHPEVSFAQVCRDWALTCRGQMVPRKKKIKKPTTKTREKKKEVGVSCLTARYSVHPCPSFPFRASSFLKRSPPPHSFKKILRTTHGLEDELWLTVFLTLFHLLYCVGYIPSTCFTSNESILHRCIRGQSKE